MSYNHGEPMTHQSMVSTALDELERHDFDAVKANIDHKHEPSNEVEMIWQEIGNKISKKLDVTYTLERPAVVSLEKEIEPEYNAFIDAFNTILSKEFKEHKISLDHLKDSKEFSSASENELILLHRFAKRRDKLLNEYAFLEGKDMYHLMGSKDKNVNRWLANQEKNNKIFSVETGGRKLYPAFQLDREGKPYEPLIESWTRFYESGRTHWDVCFWLTTFQSAITEKVNVASKSLKGKSIQEAMLLADKASEQTKRVEMRPIEALVQKMNDIFQLYVEKWLNPDEMKLKRRKLDVQEHSADV